MPQHGLNVVVQRRFDCCAASRGDLGVPLTEPAYASHGCEQPGQQLAGVVTVCGVAFDYPKAILGGTDALVLIPLSQHQQLRATLRVPSADIAWGRWCLGEIGRPRGDWVLTANRNSAAVLENHGKGNRVEQDRCDVCSAKDTFK